MLADSATVDLERYLVDKTKENACGCLALRMLSLWSSAVPT
jgi:hypothetical protein